MLYNVLSQVDLQTLGHSNKESIQAGTTKVQCPINPEKSASIAVLEKMKDVFLGCNDEVVLNRLIVLHSDSSSVQEKELAFNELKEMAYPANQYSFNQTVSVENGQFTKNFVIVESHNPLNQLMNIQQHISFYEATDNYVLNKNFIDVYRIDSRSPDVIFAEGFKARGKILHSLSGHQRQPADDTAFISTTTLTPDEMTKSTLSTFLKDSVLEAGLSSNELLLLTPEQMEFHEIDNACALPCQMLAGEARSYIYKMVLLPMQGIDMNNSLGNLSVHSDQNEIVVMEKIDPRHIVGVYEIVGKYPSDDHEIHISAEAKVTISHSGN